MRALGLSLALAATTAACSAQPLGVARLSLGTASVPEGVDRLTLTLSAPDFAPRDVEVDLDTLSFDVEVPAGSARTLTVLGETDAGGVWLPWYWGTTSFTMAPGEITGVVVPAVPAARIHPLVLLDGAPAEGATVTTTLLESLADLPDEFEDPSATGEGPGRTLPVGRVALRAELQRGVAAWSTVAGGVEFDLRQGDVVTVPLVLEPRGQTPVVDHLELLLGEVRVGEAVDLVVRAVDAGGTSVESFDGVVELLSTDAGALSLPGPYAFEPEVDRGEHVFEGGAVGLAARAGIVVRATLQGDPSVSGERLVDVLAVDEVVGDAVRLVIEVLGEVHGGLLARPVDLRVTALDAAGRVATGYTGRVTFADSDRLLLAVPSDTTFTPGDAGVHRFEGGVLSLVNAGHASVRVRDADDAVVAGELAIDVL
jgi:hypothetical protein